MKSNIAFYLEVMNKGVNKGQLNTPRKKFKFTTRALLLYKHTKKIGDFLRAHKYLSTCIYQYPMLISKIHRPYLCNSFKTEKKARSIIENFIFLDRYFKENIAKELYINKTIELAEIIGKNESKFKLTLSLYPNFDKEGEFNIRLLNDKNNVLAISTFSFLKQNDKYQFFIGGLQGASKNTDHNEIKEATKNLFGIFPKKLVIDTLYFIERGLNLNLDKVCVSTNQHIYLANRYKFKKQRTVHADYNSFWESLNAKIHNGIFYILPETLERKDIEDIPSKKRSQYRKRYSIVDNIENQIINLFRD